MISQITGTDINKLLYTDKSTISTTSMVQEVRAAQDYQKLDVQREMCPVQAVLYRHHKAICTKYSNKQTQNPTRNELYAILVRF